MTGQASATAISNNQVPPRGCLLLHVCASAELATLLLSCARLGHPHRSSWLQQYVTTAQQQLEATLQADTGACVGTANQQLKAAVVHSGVIDDAEAGTAQQAVAEPVQDRAAGSSIDGSSSAAAAGASADEGELQEFTATVAQLVEALAR